MFKWFIGEGPRGIGSLLLGVGTIIIGCQSSDVLNKILKIESDVNALRIERKKIEVDKNNLKKEIATTRINLDLEKLKIKNSGSSQPPPKEKIARIIKRRFELYDSKVAINDSKINDVAEKIQKATNDKGRVFILNQFLQEETPR